MSRKKFLKLKILCKEYIDLFYEAKIDVSRIEIDGKLYGIELHITTNRPFALRDPIVFNIDSRMNDGMFSINDISHEEGYIYPHVEITVLSGAGNSYIEIYNAIEDRTTYIDNCSKNEVITMDYPIIRSSLSYLPNRQPRNIQNDFNWNFLRIANANGNSRNDFEIFGDCKIKIEYSPIVKVGL